MSVKYLISLAVLFTIDTYCQKVDIILIGVSHNYANYPEQDFSSIQAKIKKFKPTAFFGEFVSSEDERRLMDYWCKQDNVKRLENLRKNRDIAIHRLPKTIDSLKKASLKNPNDFRLKIDLAHAYYLSQDVANGHFQFWQVFSQLLQAPDAALENYLNEVLSPQLDVSGRSMKRIKTSEYATIAFPVMSEIGIRELQSMDSQDYDLNWSAAAIAFYNKFELFKKDSLGSVANGLNIFLSKRDQGFKSDGDISKTSKQVTEWMNTNEASAIYASGDFYFAEMYDLPGFPKEEMSAQLHWWLMRNDAMCRNVVNRARAMGAKKVVVIAGANHRKFMQEIFKKMPNVSVRNINEVK